MPANVTVELARYALGPRRSHAVYLRQQWTGSWTKVPWLFADEIAWATAPAVGAATLSWRFGRGMRQGEMQLGNVNRLANFQRYYVAIECENGDSENPLTWFGTVEIQTDVVLGLVGLANIPTGLTAVSCIGLEQILRDYPVRTSVWREENTAATFRVERAYTFNQPDAIGTPMGNRHPQQHVFSAKIKDADATWTTRKIVDYLAFTQRPKTDNGVELPLSLDADAALVLPDWDLPVIEQHGKTLGQLLDEAMPVGRGLTWHVTVDESNQIVVAPSSLLGAAVATPLGQLAANPRRLHIEADGDATWQWSPSGSSLQQYEQCRVIGARRTSTVTLQYPIVAVGWPDALKTEYDQAASTQAGYADWDTYKKQGHNELVRTRDRLASVYRRFQIGNGWAQTVTVGEAQEAVFRKHPLNSVEKYPVNPRELYILPTTKLKDGFDYTNTSTTVVLPPVKVATGPHNYLPPLVIFRDIVPTESGGSTYRHYQVEKIAALAKLETKSPDEERRWHGHVHVGEQERAVLINVSGAPQHIIASADFTKLPVDQHLPPWNWRDAFFTVTLTDDRHCEGVYPADDTLPGTVNRLVRTLVIDAGEKYQQDWIVPTTVIGVAADGSLARCPNGGWLNDDRPKLEARARMAWEYYRQRRTSIVLGGKDLAASVSIRLGDYIESISDADPLTVGSIVSEIRVRFPEGPPGSVPAPEIRFATAFADLDASVFVAREAS